MGGADPPAPPNKQYGGVRPPQPPSIKILGGAGPPQNPKLGAYAFYNKQINAKKYEWTFGSVQIVMDRQCT